jgi:hypothetical protein
MVVPLWREGKEQIAMLRKGICLFIAVVCMCSILGERAQMGAAATHRN